MQPDMTATGEEQAAMEFRRLWKTEEFLQALANYQRCRNGPWEEFRDAAVKLAEFFA